MTQYLTKETALQAAKDSIPAYENPCIELLYFGDREVVNRVRCKNFLKLLLCTLLLLPLLLLALVVGGPCFLLALTSPDVLLKRAVEQHLLVIGKRHFYIVSPATNDSPVAYLWGMLPLYLRADKRLSFAAQRSDSFYRKGSYEELPRLMKERTFFRPTKLILTFEEEAYTLYVSSPAEVIKVLRDKSKGVELEDLETHLQQKRAKSAAKEAARKQNKYRKEMRTPTKQLNDLPVSLPLRPSPSGAAAVVEIIVANEVQDSSENRGKAEKLKAELDSTSELAFELKKAQEL